MRESELTNERSVCQRCVALIQWLIFGQSFVSLFVAVATKYVLVVHATRAHNTERIYGQPSIFLINICSMLSLRLHFFFRLLLLSSIRICTKMEIIYWLNYALFGSASKNNSAEVRSYFFIYSMCKMSGVTGLCHVRVAVARMRNRRKPLPKKRCYLN